MRYLVPLFLVAVAVRYAFGVEFEGATDLPNHLARAQVLRDCLFEQESPICSSFDTRLLPIASILPDLFMASILSVGNVFTAQKLSQFFLVLLLLSAWTFLYRRVVGKLGAAWFAGMFVLFGNFLTHGLFGLLVSCALFFFWAGSWWPLRRERRFSTLMKLSLALVVIYLCDWAGCLFAIALFYFYEVGQILCAKFSKASLRVFVSTWPIAITAAFLWAAHEYILVEFKSEVSLATTVPLKLKLIRLLYPLINFSKYDEIGLFVLAIAGASLCFSSGALKRLFRSFWMHATLGFALLYYLGTVTAGGEGDLDLRFLLPAFACFCLSLGTEGLKRQVLGIAVAGCAFLASFELGQNYRRQLSSEIAEITPLLNSLEPGQRLFAITGTRNFPVGVNSRVYPYWYLADYALPAKRNVVPDLFDCHLKDYLRYFCYKTPENEALIKKARYEGLGGLSKEELELISEHYDRVLIMGAPDILRADPKLDPLKFTEIAAGRQVVLFETRRPPGVS